MSLRNVTILTAWILIVSANAQESSGQEESTDALLARMKKASAREERGEAFEKLVARDKPTVEKVKQFIDQRVGELEKQYVDTLNASLKTHYIERLNSLTDEQILKIQRTRRLWRHYLLTTKSQHDFQAVFLTPAKEVAAILLLNVEQIADNKVNTQRGDLLEFGGYQTQCKQALGIDPDPTKGKKSPTGIDIPSLDSPPTFQSNLNYLERSLVLANTVAPEGARKVLLKNADVARDIDIEEADFVMFGNEVRMVMGTIAWAVDPLVCACTRDHSHDRKEGKASGHSSTIPGKEGFVDRLKRFGTYGSSEGAGGGRNGRNYIEGLSYGGGHTGPLYSLIRNVVGVGRRGGVYTSVYRTDKEYIHPCQVTSGEHFMPPGISSKDLAGSQAAAICVCMKQGQFGAANTIVSRALAPAPAVERSSAAILAGMGGGNKAELGARDRMIFRFLQAAIQVEMDWRIAELEAFSKSGDVYEFKCRLDIAMKDFQNMPAFTERLAPFVERVKAKDFSRELQAGYAYHQIATGESSDEVRNQNLKLFSQNFKDSIYAKAAEVYVAKTDEKTPFTLFMEKCDSLAKYNYPPAAKQSKR